MSFMALHISKCRILHVSNTIRIGFERTACKIQRPFQTSNFRHVMNSIRFGRCLELRKACDIQRHMKISFIKILKLIK
jgi:hypothetical protein